MTTIEKTYTYGDGTTKTMLRIYADEGKALTMDNENMWKSIDVDPDDVGNWSEVETEYPDEDVSADDIADALEDIT